MLKPTILFPFGALALALSTSLASPSDAAPKNTVRAGEGAEAVEPFIDLSAEGRQEARFDSSCGSVGVEVIDPASTTPRFVLSGSCNGTAFDVVATPTALPGKPRVSRVRFMDIATGQERIASAAHLEVQVFGGVGEPVSGRLDFTMPATLQRPERRVVGTFAATRDSDRSSP